MFKDSKKITAARKLVATTQWRVDAQRQWMDDHGGSRLNYIARYGRSDDPRRTGDGGSAIFDADTAELEARIRATAAARAALNAASS